jgi:hypothetical protein
MAIIKIHICEENPEHDYRMELWTLREEKDIFHIDVKG